MKLIKPNILFLLFFIPTILFANKIDSLKQIIDSKKGIQKAKEYTKIADAYIKINLDSALYFDSLALKITQDENYPELQYTIRNKISTIYYYKSDYKNAITNLKLLLDYARKINDKEKIGSTLNKIGAMYYTWGVIENALEYFLKSIKVFEELKDEEQIASINNNIGLVYNELESYELAFDFFNQAIDYFQNSNDSVNYSSCLNNLGSSFIGLKNFDSALFYFNKSIDLKIKLNDDIGLANTYGNIGDAYYELEDYDEALLYYKKILFISERQNNTRLKALICISLAKTYYQLKFNEMALDYLSKAEKYSNEVGLNITLKDSYELFAKIYKEKHDFKTSNYYLEKYITIKDSIFSKEKTDKLSELMVIYNTEAKERELIQIKEDEKNNKKLIVKANDIKHYMIITIILILIISFMIFSRYKIKINNAKILKEKNDKIAEINKQLIVFNTELEQKIQDRTKELKQEIESKLQVESSLNTSIEREKKATYLKNFFLSNISHEIRTPLNAISGLASLLKSKVEKEIEPTTKEFINGIIQNSNRLLNLLNNILDFSRLEANDIVINQKHCSLNEITKNICELHKFKINDKKLNLETTFSDIPNIITDRANLEKVINDIIDNAVRYTDKGAISIETGFYKEYDEVFVRIKDTGVGIDNEYLPYIFDTFSQESIGYERKYQGMGLGLPLSKRLLELMGGRIEISSQKDKGTIVNIFIPSNISIQKNDTKEQKINLISDDIFKQKQFEVFLVEDDYFNKLVIHNLLERITNVTSATNGQEALDLIEKRLEEGIEFDIMLIDINLPDGWDGIKLMKIIKEKWPIYKDVIFIAQTAYSNEKDKKAIMDAGFNEYITKPIDSDYLINLVKHKLMQ
jgi:signal transduction histidine kinase/CheY-like chemotaxis protein